MYSPVLKIFNGFVKFVSILTKVKDSSKKIKKKYKKLEIQVLKLIRSQLVVK